MHFVAFFCLSFVSYLNDFNWDFGKVRKSSQVTQFSEIPFIQAVIKIRRFSRMGYKILSTTLVTCNEQLTQSSLLGFSLCQAWSTDKVISSISLFLRTQYLRSIATGREILNFPSFHGLNISGIYWNGSKSFGFNILLKTND